MPTSSVRSPLQKHWSSPTIRINGQDICLEVKENICGSCSDIGNNPVDCRIFLYEGEEYEVPPKAMIIDAILSYVYGGEKIQVKKEPYTLPENLRMFFEGKQSNTNCDCGSRCC